ncbi:4'-phosphopantetheinyl transferase family protein [Tenacibaculum sp. MEBiC06402]|uniref:4'-phosphopantetheinyl transferase family protein n=1 Tax=unclassified Tenacibaculum TaxID=2635139 RepID=UPI003B995D3A
MIGNDIVDIKITKEQVNWQRKRFLDKVFTMHEQRLITNASDPFSVVWRLWSMKESAYKCYVRYHQKRFFDPKKLSCTMHDLHFGHVTIDDFKFPIKTTVNSNYIYSTISKSGTENYCFHIESVSTINQQLEVYNQLKQIMSKRLAVESEKISIQKNTVGIPKLTINKIESDIVFSLSHHGNFGAISILKSTK